MPSKRTGDAALNKELDRLEETYGIEATKKEYVRRASAGVGVLHPGMGLAALAAPLHEHFRLRGIPERLWPDLISVADQAIALRVKTAVRPKWEERAKFAELKDLSSPAFLKRVYADEIAGDGTIEKEAVRKIDRKLMAAVETYISGREGRQRDMGDAEGLRLIAGPRTRPKRPSLG